jgi:hypothetical protein
MDILEKEFMRAMEVLLNWMILSDALPRTRMGIFLGTPLSFADLDSNKCFMFSTFYFILKTVPQVL